MTEKGRLYEDLINEARYLKSLAKSFRDTGNIIMYENLNDCANSIEITQKLLVEADAKELDERLQQVHESGAAIFEAIMHTSKNECTP